MPSDTERLSGLNKLGNLVYEQSEHLLGKIRKKRQNSPDLEAAESVIEKTNNNKLTLWQD